STLRFQSGPRVSDQEFTIDEKDVGLDAGKAVVQGVEQRMLVLIVIVGMSVDERRGFLRCERRREQKVDLKKEGHGGAQARHGKETPAMTVQALGTASTSDQMDFVGTTRCSFRPAAVNNSPNSAAVRSRPPCVACSISKSINMPEG